MNWLADPRLRFGLLVALLIHGLVIFGVGLRAFAPPPPVNQVRSLTVDFINAQAPAPLDEAFGMAPLAPAAATPPPPTLSAIGPIQPLTPAIPTAQLPSGGVREKRLDLRSMSRLEQLYVEQWVEHIETLANEKLLNELKRLGRHQRGPILDVAINADGSVNRITVTRSSGRRALDQAMIRLVENAAPFDAFPVALQQHYDVLTIPREWQLKFD